MYLFHNTDEKSLKLILKDGYIKSASILKKENEKITLGEGFGIYDNNKFIYFSCVDKLFSRKIYASVILYFNSELLYNKSFYVSTVHSGSPEYLAEWTIDNKKEYKRYYKRFNKNYNSILQKLFNNSITKLPNGDTFQAFQQIAILNKINLKYLVAIEFTHKPKTHLLNFLNNFFPEILIKIN
jgi:hypothetical protein